MPPLLGADLERAIALPASLQGYRFEDGLLGEIMQDVGKEHGCLPLLQFALTELWEKRDSEKHQLTVEQYRVMGGVNGALDRHAEMIYHDFIEQEQEWVKRLFLKLVRTHEGDKDTRQRQPKAKMLAIGGENEREQREKVRSGFSSQLHPYILNKIWFFSCDRILKQAIYVPDFSTSQNRVAPIRYVQSL
nr:hypothetical protein [Nostoc commune]